MSGLGTTTFLAWREDRKNYKIADVIGDAVDRYLSKPAFTGKPNRVLVASQHAAALGPVVTVETARGPVALDVQPMNWMDPGTIYVGRV